MKILRDYHHTFHVLRLHYLFCIDCGFMGIVSVLVQKNIILLYLMLDQIVSHDLYLFIAFNT